MQLVTKYNNLVTTIQKYINEGKSVPKGTHVPQYIDCDGLFALDVDDSIWEDIELNDELTLSDWLYNENTWQGIQYLHQYE